MMLRHGGADGGGVAQMRMFNSRYLSIFSALFLLLTFTTTAQAQVGYGPGFDPCGDNCQTALVHFCTQLRDATQQSDCWCGVGDLDHQYTERMDACLATCDPAISKRDVQRDMILRYRKVVCNGSTKEDEEFRAYYEEKYGETFTPKATAAAPPPPPTVTVEACPDCSNLTPTSFAEDVSSSGTAIGDTISSKVPSTSPIPSESTAPIVSLPATTGTSFANQSRPTLDTGEIAGISLGAVIAVVGLISLFIIRRRRNQWQELERRRFNSSPASHDEYVWSPISPVAGKSRAPSSLDRIRQRFSVKHSIYNFLGWKPQPSSLDIGPDSIDEKRVSYRASHEIIRVPTIRVTSPGGANRKLQTSPIAMMSGASALGEGIPVGSASPKGPLPPPPAPQPQLPPSPPLFYPPSRFIPSISTTTSGGACSSIHVRPEFILPPFPAPPTTLPPHAITTSTAVPASDIGRFTHPYAHGHDPTRLSAVSVVTDIDLGRMSSASFAESACSQQTDVVDDDDDCRSEWTDYNDFQTAGRETLERRARLDDLFLAVEAGYRGTYVEEHGGLAQSAAPATTARSGECGRRLC